MDGVAKLVCHPVFPQFNLRLGGPDGGWRLVPYAKFLKLLGRPGINPEGPHQEVAILQQLPPGIEPGLIFLKTYVVYYGAFYPGPMGNGLLQKELIKALDVLPHTPLGPTPSIGGGYAPLLEAWGLYLDATLLGMEVIRLYAPLHDGRR